MVVKRGGGGIISSGLKTGVGGFSQVEETVAGLVKLSRVGMGSYWSAVVRVSYVVVICGCMWFYPTTGSRRHLRGRVGGYTWLYVVRNLFCYKHVRMRPLGLVFKYLEKYER